MLNMDFSIPVRQSVDELEWLPSPMQGVERKPLAREDAERGHATSIVRYAPGSIFRAHPHPLGEEILVLQGVFCDETGHYPAGTYFRNPPGSSHAPFSPDGCVLFVKLHQFAPLDSKQVLVAAEVFNDLPCNQPHLLHQYQTEQVYLLRVNANSDFSVLFDEVNEAFELLVVEGRVSYQEKDLSALSWLRTPSIDLNHLKAKESSMLWLKFGHF
ncbi:cupin domain-containing protein [Marinomonas fungiae]|uniref:Anti-ECFsigma factor, ChrR n=1 Tax=Marinomonas fungiae TaxID=1137284 RepID=A0A0K6IJ05_9GAMM|nr:cupin domain-containing protein [Marinomonas fungiae]CUB03074.1 anti-ECFsigma factor, ChrR [Marinomonas fungiae]